MATGGPRFMDPYTVYRDILVFWHPQIILIYSDTCTCTLNRMLVTEDAKTFTLFTKHHQFSVFDYKITPHFSDEVGKKFSSFIWIYLDNYPHVPLHSIHIPLLTRSVPTLGLSVDPTLMRPLYLYLSTTLLTFSDSYTCPPA
jgi:hypothetical protein